MTALANRDSLRELASGRTNQILSHMVFGFTRCDIASSGPARRMRAQLCSLDLNLRKCCSRRHERMSHG